MGSFLFKKFTVRQHQSAMKVNTDGVLLPAWVGIKHFEVPQDGVFRVLDIGTGTGVIALITAQRLEQSGMITNFEITGIDIDEVSSQEAQFNFSSSPWSRFMISKHISLQQFLVEEGVRLKGKFSLILSNPPYFASSLKAPDQRRSDARHNDTLPFAHILSGAETLLNESGILALVLPVKEGEMFIEQAANSSLKLIRICRVRTLAGKKEKRLLLEFSRSKCGSNLNGEIAEEELIIQERGGEYYSHAYCSLVGDYYLKLFKTL
jgi:tRNA1Val (adenine37-N6)-methyltransferase